MYPEGPLSIKTLRTKNIQIHILKAVKTAKQFPHPRAEKRHPLNDFLPKITLLMFNYEDFASVSIFIKYYIFLIVKP